MGLGIVKLISAILFLSGIMVLSTGCSFQGFSAKSLQSGSSLGENTTPAPTASPLSAGGQDFQTRCAQPSVVKCVGFDTAADFSNGSGDLNGAYGFNAGIMPPSGASDYTRAVRDTSVKASGNSSLKFTIPSKSGDDTSGAYFTNFSNDLSLQFDENSEFFIQWRQRFSPEYISTQYTDAGGWKQIIVGTGDKSPNNIYASCSDLTVVLTNYYQKGFPIAYNSCSASASHGAYDPFFEPVGSLDPTDFKLQNARPSPGCMYLQESTSFFPPIGNCFGYVANEWMTFQLRVKTGQRIGDEFKGSYVTLWAAREGKPSEELIKWGPYNLNAGSAAENQKFGKVWLTPYNTGKNASQSHPTAYTWYDELIISTDKIADPPSEPVPGPVPAPTPIPAPSPIPVPNPTLPPTPGPIGLPYQLPGAGQAVAIGVNTADDIRPPTLESLLWAYATFGCYGTGAFVPDYSSIGAYVVAASGGHNCPAYNIDAVIFDFTDATWKLRRNANGIAPRDADYSEAETTGAPYYEIRGATAGQVPSPVHLYQTALHIPPSLGGGPKGSYIKLGSSAVVMESRISGVSHRMDLSTGLWTRVTNDLFTNMNLHVSTGVFDPVTKRYYLINDAFHIYTTLYYLDASDWRVKQTASFPYPPGYVGQGYFTFFLDPIRRLIVAQKIGAPLLAIDLNDIPAGWVVLNSSGTPPGEYANRWAFYEPDGRFYTRGNNTGQVIKRLTPPSGDWKTGIWTYSNVTIGGTTMPNYTTTGGGTPHDGTFFYVPGLKSLAWISGESSKVIILKPPTDPK